MNRRMWARARLAGGAVILVVLVWRLGTGPFLDGLRAISGWSLAAAAAIAVLSTVCCAWRWSLVARGLGVAVPLPAAIAAYYRSQFLNTALPGGVLGDVHRGVRHGRAVGDVGRGLRAVGWERVAGQLVQLAIALVVLLIMPSPVRSAVPTVAITGAVVVVGVAIVVRAQPGHRESRWSRAGRAARADVRDGLLARSSWPGILAASTVVVAAHTATFLLAARTAGSTAPLATLLPLAILVLVATSLPLNIGGWGPREGVAAALFGAAGLGANQGLAVATVYGVLVIAATLPGAAVLLLSWRRPPDPAAVSRGLAPEPAGLAARG
jgi:glycosyltransferase 2 family protein